MASRNTSDNEIRVLHFTPKKFLLGAFLACTAFLICWHYYSSPTFGVAFALLLIAVGSFGIELGNKKAAYLIEIIWGLAFVAICCGAALYLLRNMFYGMGLFDLEAIKLLCNYLLILMICCLIYTVCGSVRWSVSISSFVAIGLAVVDGFVIQFRGREICIDDILSVGTAMSVAGEYTYFIPAYVVFCFLLWGVLAFSALSLPRTKRSHPIRRRLIAFSVAVIAFISMHLCSINMSPKHWGVDGTVNNGLFLNMYLGFRESFIKEPEGYSSEAVAAIADEAAFQTMATTEKGEFPNILVIMNESFADFEGFANKPQFSSVLTPYLDQLSDNIIRGHALCSVYGGNTANSELEFLMGHSMGFFPNGVSSVPYQQYLGKEVYSLPHLMRYLGYDTVATHPYRAEGWLRDKLYPTFGFSESSFIEDYPQKQLIRNYVSDLEMYEYILGLLCSEEQQAPLFLFGITMQNHGGYGYEGENYTKTIELVGYDTQYPMAEQYFSLINVSDKALESLLGELEKFEEDTVVLFFGDHLPRIEEEFFSQLNGSPIDSLEEQMARHTVPFFIWANYDIPEYKVELTSLNYLSCYLLETAGIDIPPYYRFLKQTENTIPAVNAYGFYSPSNGRFIGFDEARGDEAEALMRYSFVQYNNIFDTEGRNKVFFGKYLD